MLLRHFISSLTRENYGILMHLRSNFVQLNFSVLECVFYSFCTTVFELISSQFLQLKFSIDLNWQHWSRSCNIFIEFLDKAFPLSSITHYNSFSSKSAPGDISMEMLPSGDLLRFLKLASLHKLTGAVLKVKRSNTVAAHKNSCFHNPDVYTIPLEPSVNYSRNDLFKRQTEIERGFVKYPGGEKGAQTVKQGKANKQRYIRFLNFRVLDSDGNRWDQRCTKWSLN